MAVEQSCIEIIVQELLDHNITLPSDIIKKAIITHKMEVMGAYEVAQDKYVGLYDKNASLDFYNEIYGN